MLNRITDKEWDLAVLYTQNAKQPDVDLAVKTIRTFQKALENPKSFLRDRMSLLDKRDLN